MLDFTIVFEVCETIGPLEDCNLDPVCWFDNFKEAETWTELLNSEFPRRSFGVITEERWNEDGIPYGATLPQGSTS